MKIINLQAENVKRLTAVEISPRENLVQITGSNGSGKTSVLDSIWWCLTGATHIQSAPIRKGANEARIRLDLGELVVTRTFRQKNGGDYTTSIDVRSADGAKFPSPQRMLDTLLDALAFDPLAFARSEPKKQFESLRRFVPDVDFEAIDGQNRADYDTRTEANRKAKEARSAAALIQVPESTPAEPVDTSALVKELEKAGEHNTDVEREKQKVAGQAENLRQIEGQLSRQVRLVAEYQGKLAAAAGEQNKLEHAIASAEKSLRERDGVPTPIDTKQFTAKIAAAETINKLVELRARKQQHAFAAAKAEAESKRLTESIESRNAAKLKAIAEAKLPIEGLGFGDGFVTLNGVPFDQASDAEQLSAGVAIAMANDPKLRVIRIRDGSLLDDGSMVRLGELAAKHDMQVWIERVDSSGKTGIVIEDGHVRDASPAKDVHPEFLGDEAVEHEGKLEEVPF